MATNFLIGRGELLTSEISPQRRGGGKAEIYTLEESRERLRPQFQETASRFDLLPASVCPFDLAVACLALHPSYIARSFFPKAFLANTGLVSVGSRARRLKPSRWKKDKPPHELETTELLVAGERSAFRQLGEWVDSAKEKVLGVSDLLHIERLEPLEASRRIISMPPGSRSAGLFFEVVLHLPSGYGVNDLQEHFLEYALGLGVRTYADLSFEVGGLWFLPVEANSLTINQLATFSLIRVIRPMPRLRGLRPMDSGSFSETLSCELPKQEPFSAEPRVAILDGGLPAEHALGSELRGYYLADVASQDCPSGPEHGLAVTSAFLFGPFATQSPSASRPYSPVDHWRIFDSRSQQEDPLELYRTLGFIEEVLLMKYYEFVNLSLGPDLPIEDCEVHSWTSKLDQLLSDGSTLMTIAAGNNGQRDWPSGNARIQVPSDCVNALAVGAACRLEGGRWQRASYSAIGPGRSPGTVKPDLLAFGGGTGSDEPFHVLAPGSLARLIAVRGTSFSAPYLLRSAVGIRAILGSELSILAIKALLIHASDRADYNINEVGWGKLPDDLDRIVTCGTGQARIVYQGQLTARKRLRAALPLPNNGVAGKVKLRATFCYACSTDPQDSVAYTRAGLEVFFRPKSKAIPADKEDANTTGFFSRKAYASEQNLRADSGKWETVLHAEKTMLGSSLDSPVFDVYYHPRESGASPHNADKIPYALIISIEAAQHPELYNEILHTHKVLTRIEPKVAVPVQI